MKDHRAYAYFYLIGRQEDSDEFELGAWSDVTSLAEQLLGKQAVVLRETIYKRCEEDLARVGQLERDAWCRDNRDVINEAGGDANAAWVLFLRGRIDRMATNLEHEVIGQMRFLLEDSEEFAEDETGDADDSSDEEREQWCDDEDQGEPEYTADDGREDAFFGVYPIGRTTR